MTLLRLTTSDVRADRTMRGSARRPALVALALATGLTIPSVAVASPMSAQIPSPYSDPSPQVQVSSTVVQPGANFRIFGSDWEPGVRLVVSVRAIDSCKRAPDRLKQARLAVLRPGSSEFTAKVRAPKRMACRYVLRVIAPSQDVKSVVQIRAVGTPR